MLRHDKWLCLMYPRLKLLHELLAETGIIIIFIDDNEMHRLRSLLDEVFGEENFIAALVWQKSKKGDAKHIATIHDYVLIAAKNLQAVHQKGVWRTEKEGVYEVLDHYNQLKSKYKTKDGFDHDSITKEMREWYNLLSRNDPRRAHKHYNFSDDRGLYFAADFAGPDDGRKSRPRYNIPHPVTNKPCKIPSTGWRWEEPKTLQALKEDPPWIHFGPDESTIPCRKSYLKFVDKEPFSSVFYRDGRSGTLDLERIIGPGMIEFPKTSEVIEKLIDLATDPEAIILDSFAGSGTTAQAVLKLNNIDKGDRRFILVECEDYADSLTAERVRRIINGYSYVGTLREELYRENVVWTMLSNDKKRQEIFDRVKSYETLDGHRFDRIAKQIKDGELIVIGEKKIKEKTEGLGGSFTFYTLGDPIDIDKILTGESLPDYKNLGAWLFHTATGQPLDASEMDQKNWYLGASEGYHVWLIYKPDLDFLKSRDAALTLSLAQEMVKSRNDKPHLVFAPARFVPNKMLHPLGVEYAPLPFALYRMEKD